MKNLTKEFDYHNHIFEVPKRGFYYIQTSMGNKIIIDKIRELPTDKAKRIKFLLVKHNFV